MPNLLCMVATPTRELFSGEIAYADVPGSEGNYGVLSGHEMLVAKNSPGVLTLWMDAAGNEKRRFALYEGATQVYADRLTVLARFGVDVDNIDASASPSWRRSMPTIPRWSPTAPSWKRPGRALPGTRPSCAWRKAHLPNSAAAAS